jgi:DNA-binding Lrp family transcriptional regulator
MGMAQIARRIGVSPSAMGNTMQKMERQHQKHKYSTASLPVQLKTLSAKDKIKKNEGGVLT